MIPDSHVNQAAGPWGRSREGQVPLGGCSDQAGEGLAECPTPRAGTPAQPALEMLPYLVLAHLSMTRAPSICTVPGLRHKDVEWV